MSHVVVCLSFSLQGTWTPLPTARRSYTEAPDRLDIGCMTVTCLYCGAYHWIKEKGSKSSNKNPRFSTCCQRGQVLLPLLPDPPSFLKRALEGEDNQSKEFCKNIRQYNMSLAFTSLGVAEDRLVNHRGGWVFHISGELHHLIGPLHPDDGNVPSFAQLYIYDPHIALNHRMNRNSNLQQETMSSLQTMLLSTHCYAGQFRHANEVLGDFESTPDAAVRLRVLPGQVSGVYAAPTSDEVAVILPGDGTSPERRDIVLRPRSSNSGSLACIDDGHLAYAPLHYVLLFPFGTHGWHRDLYHQISPGQDGATEHNTRRVSQTEFSAFRLHTRSGEYATIHRGRRLFQQYVIDMWASTDQTRLSYL